MGPIEREELRWYLERYYSWPSGVFQERAKKVEDLLPVWGKKLYDALFDAGSREVSDVLRMWQDAEEGARRFTVYVDKKMVAAVDGSETALANEAATKLLTLPWELVHNGTGYLFQGGSPAPVRRQLPNTKKLKAMVTEPPIRILLVSPRPEDDIAGYIDHRIIAIPLVNALENLGPLAELTVLTPPTFHALNERLLTAKKEGTPFHVVHFDGHGVFDKKVGLGGLCFEDPQDIKKLQHRRSDIIDAKKIAAVVQNHRIPLIFLEACQSAQTEKDPGASVAATLLDQGVASVVAMSHIVLVETARRFVKAFYQQLAQGNPVGEAMLAGRRQLHGNAFRINIFGAGKLYLQDWFVPVLYQEKEDLQLLTHVPSRPVQEIDQKSLTQRMEALPGEPPHHFVGRSRELLTLERLLHLEKYGVILGQGGEGKTTLAAELARWLVRTGRFKGAVFVSMEDIYDGRTVVDVMGRQLLTNFSVAEYEQLDQALLPIEAALREEATLLLLDNMESILPPKDTHQPTRMEPLALKAFFALCSRLNNVGDTRLLFTSREVLLKPFASGRQTITLSRLDKQDAIDLVHQAMIEAGVEPNENDDGSAQPEVEALVQSVHCHARSLVLLVPYIGQLGVRHTTENLGKIMADLDKQYPDERERSLFASVQLSLYRLKPEIQEKIKPLGAFQGGGTIPIIGMVLQVAEEERDALLQALIQLKLAEPMPYNFVRFHPALCPFLWGQMTADEQKESTQRWAESMIQLSGFLYGQRSEDVQLSATLTTLELPNLMRLLHHVEAQENPDTTVDLATTLEHLISYLGRKDLLAVVADIRQEEAKKLGEWSRTRFRAAFVQIERLLGSGNLKQALTEAQALLEKSLQEGTYDDADYDIAMAFKVLGDALETGGLADAALTQYREAYQRFQGLADQGDTDAATMASSSLTGMGDCLTDLGQLDEAASAYEEGIKRAETLKDERGIAVNKGQLGSVRLRQKRYDDALDAYHESRTLFENLGEQEAVAVAWHQIGIVHQEAGQYDAAEQAYRKSLAIHVQQSNPAVEASTLNQIGILYDKMGRVEEAVVFLRQAVDRSVELGDKAKEGLRRNNLADQLITLKRYAEARAEILLAIKCKEPYGHTALPWTSWDILHDLEAAEGNTGAAAQARQKSVDLFLAYRTDNGENHEFGGRLCHRFRQAMKENKGGEITTKLEELANHPDIREYKKLLITKLQAILGGERGTGLWEDEGLFYMDAVEVKMLVNEIEK
jgi:tetratricopeptide (TPR) repeat protein